MAVLTRTFADSFLNASTEYSVLAIKPQVVDATARLVQKTMTNTTYPKPSVMTMASGFLMNTMNHSLTAKHLQNDVTSHTENHVASLTYDIHTTTSSSSFPTMISKTLSTSPNSTILTGRNLTVYLDELQAEEFKIYLVTLVILVLVAVCGLVGNVLVLLIYKSKFHRTPTRIFIMAIALFDLVSNLLCIPGETYDFFHLWNYTSPNLCRLVRYATASTTITSAWLLLALAVARYRKICRPFGWQVTSRQAKILSTVIAMTSWSIAVPYAILSGLRTRKTPLPNVFGTECATDDLYMTSIWPLVNNGFFLLLFLSLCVPLVTLYVLIGVQARRHSKIHGIPAINLKTSVTATNTLSMTDDATSEGQGRHHGIKSWFGRRRKDYRINNAKVNEHTDVTPSTQNTLTPDLSVSENNVSKTKLCKLSEKKTPDNSEARYSVKMVRSPGGEEVKVNFSLVSELTSKLNDVKNDNISSASTSDCEEDLKIVENSQNESKVSDNRVTCMVSGEDKVNDIICKDVETDEDVISEDDESQSDIASRLQWIDMMHSTSRQSQKVERAADGSCNNAPRKKSSLPGISVSRENSLRLLQRAFFDTITRKKNSNARKESGSAQMATDGERRNSRTSQLTNSSEKQNVVNDSTNNNNNKYGATNSKCENTGHEKDCTCENLTITGNGNDKIANQSTLNNLSSQQGSAKITSNKTTRFNVDEEMASRKTDEENNQIASKISPDDKHRLCKKKVGGQKSGSSGGGGVGGGVISRTTAMLILITTVYVTGFVPYLILVFYQFIMADHFRSMGPVASAMDHLFRRLYFINSAANPVIYSACDARFRLAVKNMFSRDKNLSS